MKYQIGQRQNQRNVHPRQTKKALKWTIPTATKKKHDFRGERSTGMDDSNCVNPHQKHTNVSTQVNQNTQNIKAPERTTPVTKKTPERPQR